MKLYEDLATWWPLLSAPEDYEEEAEFYTRAFRDVLGTDPARPTMLELGSGGGNNASFMKAHFDLVLVDRSENMLEVSRQLNPELEHICGDMRSVRLERQFDCVFVHDAVCYMQTPEDLRATIETVALHCRPGGVALFAPDYVMETFRPSTSHGGHDGPDRALRYLAWTRAPADGERTYVVDYAYVLREADDTVHVHHDRHVEGLFARDEWRDLLEAAGFAVKIRPLEHSEVDPETHEIFVCRKDSG